MERWGRDDETTRTFDLDMVRAPEVRPPSTPPRERPLRVVEIDEGRATRRDPRTE